MTGYNQNAAAFRFHYDFPAGYHNRVGGYSFADGHAEIKRWMDRRTVPPIFKGVSLFNSQEFTPSPRNPDIGWLQERSTRKK